MNKYISITLSSLLIASCGGGGGGSSSTTPTTPAPTVNLTAEPTSVLLESTSTLTWSSNNATSCSATWTSQTGTSGSEAVTISSAGNNSFSITCTGAGGSGSASVTVEGYRETDGVVVDGYISGAEVFIDEDDDWLLDSNENSTTSDNDGKFTIKYANGNLVSIGGTDLDSQILLDNLLITHKLAGHTEFKAVTPVTSVASFMENASLVNAALGIDSSIDVFSFDPVANKGDGGINDYLYEKGNQLTVLAFALQNITNNLNTTTETTQDYFKAITEEIEKEYTETETKVDIETEAFVTKAFENVIAAKSVTIDGTAKANVTQALSGMLPIIQVKSSDDLTTGIIRFAVSTLQTDIQAIANGTATAETVTSYTEDLLNFIAEDQSIDSGEIAPDINAIADTASTYEDTEVQINVLLNDSYVTSSSFSLSATNGTNGSTSVSNNIITFSPDSDYNGSDSFSYTLTQGDKTSSADVMVTIEAVNDAPSIDIPSTIEVEEGQTAVITVSVSDVDEDELTLTLGGTDADSFNLSDESVLTFKEAPDYETKTSYSITLTLTDGTETVTKDVTIIITDINDAAPVFTSEATFSAAENQTAIGTVTATDPEGDSFSFSISGSELSITSEGVLSFTSAPDYETKATYTATVTAVDTEDNSATQDITVNVTNVNDNSPVFTSNTTFSAEENQTSIGTVTVADADGDDIGFTVSGDELEISSSGDLTFITAPDYEAKITYTATVTASDGANSVTQNITVNVINVNDVAPEFTSEATFSADENQTAIGTVTATDVDSDDVAFTVSGSELTITTNGILTFTDAPDYETKTTYTATVTASDGTNSSTQEIVVNIINLNDNGPSFTSIPTFSIEENQTAIGTVTATDADGDDVAFTVSGSELSITSTGVLSFISAPDYETKTTYTATVTASDGANSSAQDISINVININDNSPVITSSANFSSDENQTAIGTVTATDADGDGIVYSISSSDITIDSSSGVIQFNASTDYETKNSYSATVTASDGSFSSSQEIVVSINDVREKTIVVTVEANNNGSGNVYVIDGVQRPSLELAKGVTYTFTHPSGHPLRFSETADGTHGGGSEFTFDVNTDNDGTTIIKVSDSTPESFYYYCSIHPGMGSDIIRIENEAPTMSLTQPTNNEGDTFYPLVFTNNENKLDINLSFSDTETPFSDLIVTATTNSGESISIFHQEGSDISTLDLSNANAGPADINISISDGEKTVSDTLKIWITRYIAIDNNTDPYSGNRAYTLFGNHSDKNRLSNYVIFSDALPDEDRVDAFRRTLKTWINLVNQTKASDILSNFFSIGVIETSLSSESALGTATGCDDRDENIYCYEDEWKAALDSLQGQYFENVVTRSVITGIDGRGVANPAWAVNIQDLPSSDSQTVRRVVYTLKHEFGHSYSLLSDEYTTDEVNCTDYNCGQIEIGPNTTAEDEPEKVRWNHHIDDLTNIPGYHDLTTEEGIGYFKGVYWGQDAGYRPSFATIMGTTPSDWLANGGEAPRELLWDKIGQEAFVIRALIFQGMHSIETTFNANNDLIVSHNFVDPSGKFEVEWYLNGEKVENNSNTFLLERKSSGIEHVSYRIKEKTQNLIFDTDDILKFRDVYSGIFGPAGPYICSEPLTSNTDYQEPYCKNTLNIKWTSYSGLYDYFFYDDVNDLINSSETSTYGLQYWYEYSGLGAMFGINWEDN